MLSLNSITCDTITVQPPLLDTVQELEELIDVYLLGEFLDKEPIMTGIDELRKTLEGSAILASKQHRVKS